LIIQRLRHCYFAALVAVICSAAVPAAAQTGAEGDWKIAVYPVLAWVPIGISIDVNLPPINGGGGGGSGPESGGKIFDGRFDGAFFGGMSAAKGAWRIDADVLWAAVGGDRVERPVLRVDLDAIYGHVSGGRKVVGDLYATAGVRRLALNYDIGLDDRIFEREPGLWDPLVGVGWHHAVNRALDVHATFEGGGFGVGSDVDLSSAVRIDWKPTAHFGLTGGYSLLYFTLSNTVNDRTFTAKQTLHGPVIGIGLYF
jgi:hypothetical protein